MPRLSLRRSFVCSLALASLLLLALQLDHNSSSSSQQSAPSGVAVGMVGSALLSDPDDPGKHHHRVGPDVGGSGLEQALVSSQSVLSAGEVAGGSNAVVQEDPAPNPPLNQQLMDDENGGGEDQGPDNDAADADNDADGPDAGGRTGGGGRSVRKAWYMRDGWVRPAPAKRDRRTGKSVDRLWPHQDPQSDRIPQQLMYRPPASGSEKGRAESVEGEEPPPPAEVPLKKIVMYNGMGSWPSVKPGRGVFLKHKCPVDTCALSSSKAEAASADAVLFKDHFSAPPYPRPHKQVWILYLLECPLHTQFFKEKAVFNWTATYRRDSDVVAPYERWQYYDGGVPRRSYGVNYAANKTRQVAWFVSNCGARNNRLQYAHELQKHIRVDIFGACGPRKCPRSSAKHCFDMLDRDYKFYLAFENSNCRDYITEKFFVNGLGHRVVPIVMGARPEDYAASAPRHSYIHVDDFESPQALAQFLHVLDKNDTLYNEYMAWKGTGEFINTYFFCRLCAMLHSDMPTKYYPDVNQWWRPQGVCINGSWRNKGIDNQSNDIPPLPAH